MLKTTHLSIFNKITLVIISLLMYILFSILYDYWCDSNMGDLYAHFNSAIAMKNGEMQYPANFLLYWLVGLGNTFYQQKWIFASIVSLSIVAKFWLTFLAFFRIAKISFYRSLGVAIGFLFLFTFPSLGILDRMLYLGNFVPNVWHNTTIIFVFPFAILLFYYGLIINRGGQNVYLVIIFIIFNAIIKPSFLFVMVPIWGILFLYDFLRKFTLSKTGIIYLSYIIVALGIMVLQSYLIYQLNVGSLSKKESGIAISFFEHYKLGKYGLINIPIAFIGGYLFPLLVVFSFKKELKASLKSLHTVFTEQYPLLMAWLSLFFAMVVYFSLIETGPRKIHGNFYWQIVPASYLLFLVSAVFFAQNYQKVSPIWRKWVILSFVAHIFIGIIYFYRVVNNGFYF